MKYFIKYNLHLAVALLILFAGGNGFAQDVSFTASASKTTVGAGEHFQITYSINGNASKFQAPAFKDFDLLMGPNQSMNVQATNTGMIQTISYSYIFIAQKEGTYDVPPATIEVNGKKLQ